MRGIPSHASERKPPHRAPPPKWSAEQLASFLPDARVELAGARPVGRGAIPEEDGLGGGGNPANSANLAQPASDAGDDPHRIVWGERIDADSLIAEIKRLNNELAAPLANSARYKSGGAQLCQRNLAVLAILFRVTEEYVPEIAFRSSAGHLRNAMARAARNAKAPSDASYAEVMRCKADLDRVLRGEKIEDREAPAAVEFWSDLASRPLLMQRMEAIHEQILAPALSNARQFTRDAARAREHAQVIGLLAEVIALANFEYADDREFVAMARELGAACADFTEAAEKKQYAGAREAAGRITQSCSVCHEAYRG